MTERTPLSNLIRTMLTTPLRGAVLCTFSAGVGGLMRAGCTEQWATEPRADGLATALDELRYPVRVSERGA